MYGTQTTKFQVLILSLFENDVKMYGTQTQRATLPILTWFENDVKMYGTQTAQKQAAFTQSLRMM